MLAEAFAEMDSIERLRCIGKFADLILAISDKWIILITTRLITADLICVFARMPRIFGIWQSIRRIRLVIKE